MRHALYRCATTAAYTISIVGMDPMSSCTRWIRKLGHSNQLLTVTPCLKLLPSFIVAHLDRVCETGGHLRSGSEPGSLDEESCIFLVLSSGHRTSWSSRTSRGPTFRKFRIFFQRTHLKIKLTIVIWASILIPKSTMYLTLVWKTCCTFLKKMYLLSAWSSSTDRTICFI